MDDSTKKFCPNCSQLYTVNIGSSKVKGNLPLFLPCGHSMCENCINNIIKCAEPIECKVCLQDVDLKPADAALLIQNRPKLHKTFPINVHMVGELVVNCIKDSENNQQKNEDYFIDLKALLKSEPTKGQCLECHASTSKMCKQCVTILCEPCFNKTHKNFVIFKNHVLQPIETRTQPNNCKTHVAKPLDYYCKDCTKAICMDCMMVGGEKSCKNHDVVSLQEINESFLEEIGEVSPKVDETFRRLTKTAVDIGYLLHNYDTDTGSAKELTNIIASIEQHFSKLCSIVQKHKEEIINIILYLKFSEKNSLQKARSEIANAIKKAKDIMDTIESTCDATKLKQINLPALLEDSKQLVDTPWHLSKTETSNESLKVIVNEDLCSLISDYVHLEGNVKSVYKLYSTSELADDFELPAAPTAPVYPPELPKDARQSAKAKVEKDPEPQKTPAVYKNVPKYRSKSGSISSLNSGGSESSCKSYITQNNNCPQPIVQPVPPFPDSHHPQQLREGSQELIYISHIVDPHNFFVQRACFQGLVKDMLRDFRNAVSFAKPSINHIAQGKTYLAFNKADNMWQRSRVIGIDRTQIDNPIIKVFCFDFGSIENVTIDRLRLLPASKIQSPYPLALNCSLANCAPKTGSWTSDEAFLIQNIIDNKQAVIHIRRIIPISNVDFKLECDVTTFDNGVSLAHALVFHDRAKLINPKLPYPSLGMKEKPQIYTSNIDFKNEAKEIVCITHVVSPDKFYVRKQHLQQVYDKLSEDLEQEYSLASNHGTIYLPEIGMACVVNMEKYRRSAEDAAWARGVVTELPGRARVRVLLPDAGAALLVHWATLRYILHKFTTLRGLATECHLAGITPLGKKWNTGSVALLQKYEGNMLELHVEDNRNRTRTNRGSIGVTLYDNTDEENLICINNEMIKHKFAVSFGMYAFNKNPVEEQVVTNKSPLVQRPKPAPKTDKIIMLKKIPPTKVNDEDLQAKDKGPLRLEAKVLYYQSPSLVYVSLLHQQKTFNELFEKMRKYYSKNKEESKKEWKVGDKCCTICIQSQTWRRAAILELEGDNAKLFYSDFACIETVPKSNLKELTSEFSLIGNAAIKCHLCGIMPAVGDEWPSITKEYLKELLDVYKRIFITKLGVFKDDSMPIEVWVYHTVQGDALEPNTSEWRCLNKKIVEQGLGIPDGSQAVATEESADISDDTLSFLNIQGSVNEWLQLEPMPLVPMKTQRCDNKSAGNSPSSFIDCDDGTKSDTDDGPESSNVLYITDWLPPEPLTCKEFTALPTYIDNDAVIYLHDISQQETLDLIRKALDVRFKGPDPKAKYTKWTVGEPCVALFFLDNRYYRGRVMEVNQENSTCLIHYIDYGNEELCSFTNLRKSVPLHQIPIQAHKCVLNRISPIGKQWDRQTLDYMHKSIVEKQCFVKVVGEEINGAIPIELKFDKLWINDHLVDFEMAVYTDGSKAVLRKFAPEPKSRKKEEAILIESDSGPDYIVEEDQDSVEQTNSSFDLNSIKGTDWNKLMDDANSLDGKYITYPKDLDDEFKCNITVINNLHTLELSILYDDDTTMMYEQMFEDLQSDGPDMPPLNGIFENKACIAMYPEDGQWYRASILQYSEAKSRIKVRYIDYGNIEVISLADAREINEEWAKLPPATVTAKIFNIKINPDINNDVVTKEFTEVFLDKGPFFAKVITYDNSVPIVELRNQNDEFVYKKLIEDKVLLKCD